MRYELWTWWDEETGWQRLDDGSLTVRTFTHSGVTAGRTYYYAVRGLDASGAPSAWSAYAKATAVGDAAVPDGTAQRAALAALYEATEGANWTRGDNWLSDEPIGTWYGVTTDPRGQVVGLRLPNNGLAGQIPALGALPGLAVLNLGENRLTGPIPDLSALIRLTSLQLHSNQLSGSIPDLRALTKLEALNLSSNRLSGTIPDLSALTALHSLSLGSNELSGPIPNLRALTNLTLLNLESNRLSGTIPDLGEVTGLALLNLGSNELSGPIPQLWALTDLELPESRIQRA